MDSMYNDDNKILECASRSFQEFMQAKDWWRRYEVYENYAVYAGDQWSEKDAAKYEKDGITRITINKSAPIIDSVVGFEIQNRSEVSYIPRTTSDPNTKKMADIAENGVNWIERTSNAQFHDSLAFSDMLVCGVGVTDLSVDYNENENGEPCKRRIFPGFFMYDPASREKNGKDTEWRAEVKVVDKRVLEQELELMGLNDDGISTGVFAFNDSQFLEYFNVLNVEVKLALIYNFQWRERTPIVRVNNPFLTEEMANNPVIMNYAGDAMQRFKLNITDGVLVFSQKDFNQFKKEMKAFGITLDKVIKQTKYKYYRAKIANGMVLEKGENFCQKGFSLDMMTGKFDEHRQCHFGIMRALKDPARMYNRAISDLQMFLNTSSKGGYIIEQTAVENVKAFVDTINKAREVTIVRDGKLSSGAIQQKQTAALPAGLVDNLGLSDTNMMQAAGVNPQWMGLMESRDMTGKLQAQLVRQGLTVLAPYFDAKKFYTINQGKLYISCLRVLAENNPGRIIRNITGDSNDKYLELFADDIAMDYDIEIEDVPSTPGERQENFEKLLEMAGQMAQYGINIMPVVLPYSPLKEEDIEAINQLMQPPPPQQPDPLQTKMLESTVALQFANAKKTEAEATKINLDMLHSSQQSPKEMQKMDADIQKTLSESKLNAAKTVDTLQRPD